MRMRTVRAVLLLAIGLYALGTEARADQYDDARTMLGLAAFPGFAQRQVSVGALPAPLEKGIPMPSGLHPLGGVTAQGGTFNAEVLFFSAETGSVPDIASYLQQLARAGWVSNAPQPVFAMPNFPTTLCKIGSMGVTVQSVDRFLIVRVGVGSCGLNGMARTTPQMHMIRAPFPTFAPPQGATFGGTSTVQTNAVSNLATTLVNTSLDPATALSSFVKQMTDAGWQQRGDTNVDGAGFSILDSAGRSWLASISLVPIARGQFMFSVSALQVQSQGAI